jgi:spermidine synthase
MNAALAAEAAVGLAVFALPTLSMGALFTDLCTQARAAGQGLGRALGVNTLGAALAPPLFGLLLIPLGGLKGAMLVLVGAYALLAWAADAPRPRALPFAATAALLGAAALLLPPLRQVDLAPGARIVDYRDGVSASVSVTEDADGTRRLRIDNREQEGSSDSLSADARQALLPLLLHPSPRRVLFLGLGTGTTASVAASDPSLQVQVAELLPEVAAARGWFTRDRFDDSAQARLQVLAADARREVLTATQPLDVVIADNFHPARSGSAALYTVEHFAAVRARLAERGLFCQWLPLHQLDLATLRSIVASFMAVYPQGGALLATHSLQTPVIGLVGRRDGRPFRLADIRRRLADPAWPAALRPASFGLQDAWPVAGAFAAGPAALRRWSAGAPLNRDAHPVVAWMAPRNAYAPQDTPAERLLQWIGDMDVAPGELVEAEAQDTRRLQAWRAARTQFLQAGLHVRPSPDAAHMLAQVRAPLLAVLRTSPDFRPAYEPLMAIAQALAPSDPVLAQQVLQELAALAMPAPTNHSVGASVP